MKINMKRELRNCDDLKESVRCIVEDRMSDLPDNVNLTAEKILGDYAWSLLDNGGPSLVGKCLKQLVNDNDLQLDPVEGIHEYPLQYRKKLAY